MRLSRIQIWGLGIVSIIGISLFFMFLEQTEINVHSMTINPPSTSIVSVTEELLQLAGNQGLKQTEWNILWRGSLTEKQFVQFSAWLDSPEHGFTEGSSSGSYSTALERVWTKEELGTLQQVQLFSYPHKEQTITNFIYIWSGNESSMEWKSNIAHIEELLNHFTNHFQVFTTIEGVADPFLFDHEANQHLFKNWIVDTYRGSVTSFISEGNFLSVTGYIPTWGEQFLSAEQDKTNVQMSARYNAIAEQTRVTLGYPLILKEH